MIAVGVASPSASGQVITTSGVIDMFAGPTKDEMALFPTRAVGLPDGRTAYSFTMFQAPGMPDDLFEAQHASRRRELANISTAQSLRP